MFIRSPLHRICLAAIFCLSAHGLAQSPAANWPFASSSGKSSPASGAPSPAGKGGHGNARNPGTLEATVFEGTSCEMTPDIFGEKEKTSGVLRLLTVDERYGFERKDELVRVPVFFHATEAAADPNGFVIVPAGGGDPIPYQADDIRRDAGGKIARMHLYFCVDELKPWARRQFHLLAGKNPGAALKPMAVRVVDDAVTLTSDGLKVSFFAKGDYEGQIKGIETPLGKVTIGRKGLTPRLTVFHFAIGTKERPGVSLINFDTPGNINIQSMRWATGPFFSKLAVCMKPKTVDDVIVEYDYMLPKQGDRIVVTQKIYLDPAFPQNFKIGTGEYGFKTGNVMLEGEFSLGATPQEQKILKVPAGLRKPMEAVQVKFYDALVNEKAGFSMFFVPYVDKGGGIRQEDGSNVVKFDGSSGLGVGDSQTMRACWGQASFIFSKALTRDALWELSCRNFGSLTAVVDEPWATVEDLHGLMPKIAKSFYDIKWWGRGWIADATLSALAHQDSAKISSRLRSIKPIGGDPYSYTYVHSSIIPVLMFYTGGSLPKDQFEKIDQAIYDGTRSSRKSNAKVNDLNFPYMQSFGLALNMHMGTYLMSFWSGKRHQDKDLMQWARDALHHPAVLGIFGRGQRPYGIAYGNGDTSDMLYQGIADLWIRAIELLCNEDLSMHPSVFARYFDSIDVTSDFYQGKIDETGKRVNTWDRANMWRGQAHPHRWEGWDASPFLGLFAKASDQGKIGITEACYFANYVAGKPINWSRLNPIFFTDALLTYGLKNYNPPPLPALPANIRITHAATGNQIAWDAVPGDNIAGYRIFRREPHGDLVVWKWINSPYKKDTAAAAAVPEASGKTEKPPEEADTNQPDAAPGPAASATASTPQPAFNFPPIPDTLVKTTSYTDPEGKPDSVYFVTAQDKEGRESRWFPNEPPPAHGNDVTQ